VETVHPVVGRMRSLGLPIKFSESKPEITRPASLLGEQSREILSEFGVPEAEIQELIDQGVVIETR